MKLRFEFEIVDTGDGFSAIPVGEGSEKFPAMLQLNEVGAKMFRYIGECETPEEVHKKLCADYPDDDKNTIAEELCKFLNRLVKAGLLVP